MIDTEARDTVVIGDVHARIDSLEATVKKFGHDVLYVLTGDLLDGETDEEKAVIETMDFVGYMVEDLGAVAVKANHEWVPEAAMFEANPEYREYWRDKIWRVSPKSEIFYGYEYNTLISYDIDPRAPNEEAIEQLRQEMKIAGHLDIIRNMPLYYENPALIVVHAGLTEEPWEKQRADLDRATAEISAEEPYFGSEPVQIFDDRRYIGNSRRRQPYYASVPFIGTHIGRRTLVTGHAHLTLSPEERITAGGRRVRLAATDNAPLPVWTSWDNQVIEIQ